MYSPTEGITPSTEATAVRCPKVFRSGLLLATPVGAYAALTYFFFRPLHADGHCQSCLGFLNGLDHLLQFPGLRLTHLLGLHTGPEAGLWGWVGGLAFNLLLYFMVGGLIRTVVSWVRRKREVP